MTLKRRPLLIGMLILLSVPSIGTAIIPCEQFVAGDSAISIVKELSPGSVYLVTLKNAKAVVRLQSRDLDPQFEEFASRFVNSSPTIRAPNTRVMDKDATQQFLRQLKDQHPDLYGRHLRHGKLVPSETTGLATLTQFVEGRLGSEFLDVISYSSLPLGLVEYSSKFLVRTAHQQNDDREIYRGRWKRLPQQTRVKLLDLLGKKFSASSENELIEKLLLMGSTMSPRDKTALRNLILDQVPQATMTQIADGWGLFTVLGIPDYHDNNWLESDGKVVNIDLTLGVGIQLKEGAKSNLELKNQQSPLGLGFSPPIDYLISHMSEPLIEFFDQLSSDQLQHWSRLSGYTMAKSDENAMLSRARSIVQYYRNQNYP